MAAPQSLLGFRKYIERGLGSITDLKLGRTGGKVGFFGTAPAVKPTALTAANVTAAAVTYGAAEQAIVENTRTRVNEMETKLKDLGLLS